MTTPQRCADLPGWDEFHYTKEGKPRVENRYPTRCKVCGQELPPGYGYASGNAAPRGEKPKITYTCNTTKTGGLPQ